MRIPRVVVGMSGGVDSAVSAYLLKQRKFDVIGVHMVNWDPIEEGTSNCSRTKDESDARDVCKKLEIPFHTVNFVKEYWSEVFLKLLENYKIGRTTIPDIECNRSIKFEHFHNRMIKEFGADYIATGHYATTSFGDFQQNRGDSKIQLLCGKDPLKDQTYFLCTVRQEQLKRSIFPLGSLLKTEVKTIAEVQGLHTVAKKAESMGICFVGKKAKFDEFIDQYIEEKSGKIRNSINDQVIGEHHGIHHFTIGKRINGKYLNTLSHFGYFVADVNNRTSEILAVEGSHHPKLYATCFEIQKPQWISGEEISFLNDPLLTCRIQRTHPAVPCSTVILDSTIMVSPKIPLRAASPGQMCVFYKNNICLGGGEVQRIINTLE